MDHPRITGQHHQTAGPLVLELNRVSNMNSKNSEIPFKLAKKKRKVSKNLVKKNQKIKSLNKAIHFLSPSDSSFSFSSVSYPKHRGSQMPKSNTKVFLAKIFLARKLDLQEDPRSYYEEFQCFYFYYYPTPTTETGTTTGQKRVFFKSQNILNLCSKLCLNKFSDL